MVWGDIASEIGQELGTNGSILEHVNFLVVDWLNALKINKNKNGKNAFAV